MAVGSCRSSGMSIEIIVIDDNSSDGTAEWLSEQTDVITLKGEGWGKPWGVNRAMQVASGTYVRYLDSDDWLRPSANERQYEIAEGQHADIVVAGLDIYDDDKLIESVPWISTDDFIAQQLGETSGSHYSAFLFRREFVKDIPHRTLFPASNFASRDDRCFILEVALRKPHIAEFPFPALCHRHHHGSRLQFNSGLRNTGSNIQTLYIYRKILHLLEQRKELTPRRKRAAIRVLWPLAHWIAYTHLTDACAVARWIYELEPEFCPPEEGVLGLLYSHIGFAATEQILRIRRTFRRFATKETSHVQI